MVQPSSRIFLAGHQGLVGSALLRVLQRREYTSILTRTRAELDLRDKGAVQRFFQENQPEYVVLAAAKVGGILANATYPADFIRDNLEIQTNVIEASRRSGVKRLLFLGSSCIYPKLCPQPIKEEYLLSGPLEPTNQAYALAKIAGIEMCWAYNRQYGTKFLAVMPTNMYGPEDNFDLLTSHVLPALIRKAVLARDGGEKQMVVWGSGNPRREFLHSDDLAEACLFLLELSDSTVDSLLCADRPPLINIGTGEDLTIRELAETVARVVGFEGELVFDAGKPDGTPRKLLDVSIMHSLGWHHRIELEEGIRSVYEVVKDRVDLWLGLATR
jgi:GDP-L-fucose synthase